MEYSDSEYSSESRDLEEYGGGESLQSILGKFREYGDIYKNVKSAHVKHQLLYSAPEEVLEAFAIATKNMLTGNIKLSNQEFALMKKHKEALKELGFQKRSSKRRRELLDQGNLLQALSKVMSKLSPDKPVEAKSKVNMPGRWGAVPPKALTPALYKTETDEM